MIGMIGFCMTNLSRSTCPRKYTLWATGSNNSSLAAGLAKAGNRGLSIDRPFVK
jgi:hypothetical protein